MIAYLDASVLLRVLLGQPDQLAEWPNIKLGVGSALVEVECLRALERLGLRDDLTVEDLAVRREAVYRLTAQMELVEPTWPVLRRAGQPFPTPLGALDAVHLATALLWRDSWGEDLALATHAPAMALAARACGLTVVGT
ncbi:MAG: PIN domain-containing protein [Gemmatimonadota bacterium]